MRPDDLQRRIEAARRQFWDKSAPYNKEISRIRRRSPDQWVKMNDGTITHLGFKLTEDDAATIAELKKMILFIYETVLKNYNLTSDQLTLT